MQETYITGSSGFIGSHLTNRIDNPISISHGDIQSTTLQPFKRFYFLSSYGNLATQTDSRETLKANISDLIAVLTQATQSPFESFVYVSSSSVKLRRQTMYSRSKKAGEEVCLAFMEKYNLPICIIRPYSVTGVGEQEQHLIPTLIRSCLEGEKMDFVSAPTHDYIDVDDVVSGMLNLSKHRAKGIYELGTGEMITNGEVKELVETVTQKKANAVNVDKLRDYDNDSWVSDNFKGRMFGWLPAKTLKQSIEEQVKTYES